MNLLSDWVASPLQATLLLPACVGLPEWAKRAAHGQKKSVDILTAGHRCSHPFTRFIVRDFRRVQEILSFSAGKVSSARTAE